MTEQKDTVASIQTLRAIAALSVVLMHELFYFDVYSAQTGAPTPSMSTWYHFKVIGGFGVDMFFIISGFIMAYLAARNPNQRLGEFFWRRVTRIVPLYWIFTAFWFWWFPHKSITFVISSFLFLPVPGTFPLNSVGWTLNMEMFFYVLFGLIVVRLKRSITWIAAIFLALDAASRYNNNYVLDFYSDPLVWCFFAGLLVHKVYRHPVLKYLAPLNVALGVGGLIFACVYFVPFAEWDPKVLIWWGAPSAILILGCVSLEASGRWRSVWNLKIMQAIGAASYSIYLVHGIGFTGLDYDLLNSSSAVQRVGSDGAVLLLIAVAAVAGYFIHRALELPSIHILRASRTFASRSLRGILRGA